MRPTAGAKPQLVVLYQGAKVYVADSFGMEVANPQPFSLAARMPHQAEFAQASASATWRRPCASIASDRPTPDSARPAATHSGEV